MKISLSLGALPTVNNSHDENLFSLHHIREDTGVLTTDLKLQAQNFLLPTQLYLELCTAASLDRNLKFVISFLISNLP